MSGPGNSGLPGQPNGMGGGLTFGTKAMGDPENGPNPNTVGDPSTTVPTSVTSPTSTYQPYSPYSTPNFGLTPYSQYSGLAQQIAASMNPKITPYAAPRTSLTDIPYAPWQMVYGGPQGGPFPGSLPTSTPPPGNTVPPVPTGQPPVANRPPGTGMPPPTGGGVGEYGGGRGGMGGNKDLPPDYFGYGGASVNYNNTRGLPPPIDPQQAQQQGGWRNAAHNWLQGVPQSWLNRTGYVQGAHGATPMSFFGTNAYKAPGPTGGGPA